MKDFLFDAFMLLVGCLLWVIFAVMVAILIFFGVWIIYQIAAFGNFRVLLLLFVAVVWLALTVAMVRVAANFWGIYCE